MNKTEITVLKQHLSSYPVILECSENGHCICVIGYKISRKKKTISFAVCSQYTGLADKKSLIQAKHGTYELFAQDNTLIQEYKMELSSIFGYRQKEHNYTKLINEGINTAKKMSRRNI